MRFFTLKTATLTALLIAVPIAGAYARGSRSVGDPPDIIIDQVQGLNQGIADARQRNTITAAEAQNLLMQAGDISQAAETTAAEGDGTIPFSTSEQLLSQLDNIEQTLRLDTSRTFAINAPHSRGNGDYPN
jgi:hypothetical protein